MRHHYVLRIVSKLLIPMIFLFALYVQFHGDFGPGGGFQAGVIFAAGFILYGIVFGLKPSRRVLSRNMLKVLAASGLLLYAMVGVATLFVGGNYLDYTPLAGSQTAGQHIGILIIELGVGITVTAVMVMVFYAFASPEAP